MSRIAYLDESQRGDFYAIAAIAVPHGAVGEARRMLRAVSPKGRVVRRHFVKESERERKRLLGVFRELPGATYVCMTTSSDAVVERRALLLDRVVQQLLVGGLDRLVLDYIDEEQQRRDRKVLWSTLRSARTVEFSYEVPHSGEPMLWVPDALAWCAGHPDWRSSLVDWVNVLDVP